MSVVVYIVPIRNNHIMFTPNTLDLGQLQSELSQIADDIDMVKRQCITIAETTKRGYSHELQDGIIFTVDLKPDPTVVIQIHDDCIESFRTSLGELIPFMPAHMKGFFKEVLRVCRL